MKKAVDIVGVPIDNLTYEDVLGKIEEYIKGHRKTYIVTANPEMIVNAYQDDSFFEVLRKAELVTPDGIGILWAAHYLSKPSPKGKIRRKFMLFFSLFSILFRPNKIKDVLRQRITGSDLFPKIVNLSQNKKWKIFLLGARKGVANTVIKQFSKLYPKANFVGSFAGTPEVSDEKEICEMINETKPDILFVAYGSPHQEFWIYRNLFKLNSVKVAIGIGGTFDFHSGKVRRAPKLMQKIGLEWLWRLVREPKRFVRIWNATIKFVSLVDKEKIK